MPNQLTNLANRFLSALTGRREGPRTKPMVFNVGLDFGTAFTKCIVRDISNNVAYPVFANIEGGQTFLFPSEVRVNKGRLTTPFDADFSGDPINYLKMALAAVAEPRERLAWLRNIEGTVPGEWRNALPQHIEALTAYFLGRVLGQAMEFIRSKAPDFGRLAEDRCFVNMAVPVGHAQLRHIEQKFITALGHGYALMGLPALKAISTEELFKHLSTQSLGNTVAQNCYLYPEVSANVQSYIRSPAARGDLHLFVDVGAGTVDLSAFIYFPESTDGRTLNYLAADVLPLGSSQIELRAVTRCNVPLGAIRKFKETNRADHALQPLISAAVKAAKNEIEHELRPRTAALLRKVRDLIPSAYDRRNRNTQFYRAQLLLGGGGLCEVPYKSAVKRAMAELEIDDPPIIPLPVPRDLVWPDRMNIRKETVYSRLSVAYGLSFLRAALDAHRFPSEIRPIPIPPPTYIEYHAPTQEEM